VEDILGEKKFGLKKSRVNKLTNSTFGGEGMATKMRTIFSPYRKKRRSRSLGYVKDQHI
jgi:hypothetical protein